MNDFTNFSSPPSPFSLPQIHSLNLTSNNLVGSIPSGVFDDLSYLYSVNFSLNSLAHKVPFDELSELIFLQILVILFIIFIYLFF